MTEGFKGKGLLWIQQHSDELKESDNESSEVSVTGQGLANSNCLVNAESTSGYFLFFNLLG